MPGHVAKIFSLRPQKFLYFFVSTQLNSTQPISLQLNLTELNSTQLPRECEILTAAADGRKSGGVDGFWKISEQNHKNMSIKDVFINSPPPPETSKYENDEVGTWGGGGSWKT